MDPTAYAAAVDKLKLQWGHDGGVVEWVNCDRMETAHAGLQWGHDGGVVEWPVHQTDRLGT